MGLKIDWAFPASRRSCLSVFLAGAQIAWIKILRQRHPSPCMRYLVGEHMGPKEAITPTERWVVTEPLSVCHLQTAAPQCPS